MNLPNKLTISRILLVPVFMLFVLPMPQWLLASSNLGFIKPELVYFNKIVINFGNYIGAVIFIISASTDKVDGYIARKRNLVTKLGIFLDPIADKLLITAALVALTERGDTSGWVAMIIIARELIVTGFRLVAVGEGVVLAADKWGKVKMVVQTVAISVALLKNYPFALFTDFPFDQYLMLLAVLITIYSGFNYIHKNNGVLRKS